MKLEEILAEKYDSFEKVKEEYNKLEIPNSLKEKTTDPELLDLFKTEKNYSNYEKNRILKENYRIQ